ncbi:MAG: hypothetical protein M3322_11525 [Actinomycetota bacterium]|nr:hypothetical protein [Actinomycetota bacterium]
MLGLDDAIAALGDGGSLLVVLAVAALLGLRHASDPDHLVAVSTLVAAEPDRPARRAARLGVSWGIGHATTLVVLGLPVVLFHRYLPERAQQAAEILVGLVIAALALRLLVRWRKARFHAHTHAHGRLVHRHLHPHSDGGRTRHDHEHVLVGSSLQAYAVGLVHGVGGSGAVGVLLLASIESRVSATLALLLFVAASALSMALLSLGLGYLLARAPVRRRLQRLAPVLAGLGLAFGAWYALAAL